MSTIPETTTLAVSSRWKGRESMADFGNNAICRANRRGSGAISQLQLFVFKEAGFHER
jgi:hypothetical protein